MQPYITLPDSDVLMNRLKSVDDAVELESLMYSVICRSGGTRVDPFQLVMLVGRAMLVLFDAYPERENPEFLKAVEKFFQMFTDDSEFVAEAIRIYKLHLVSEPVNRR